MKYYHLCTAQSTQAALASMWEGADILQGAYNSPKPASLSRATAELQKGSEGAKQGFVCFLKGFFFGKSGRVKGKRNPPSCPEDNGQCFSSVPQLC